MDDGDNNERDKKIRKPASSKHIIEGFNEDLNLIRNEYSHQSGDLRLQEFLNYWRSSHMDCLFANRFDPRELLETITELNKRLVPILANKSNDLTSRVVALYLLLCLFVKQPERMRRKIRLTCEDALSVTQLCELVQHEYSHDDTKFAWKQLRQLEAIDFVEERIIFGPSLLLQRHSRANTSGADSEEFHTLADPLQEALADTRCFIEQKISPAMSELDRMCSSYDQLREMLKLSEFCDATVEIQSNGTPRDQVERAKSLLSEYKA